MAGPSVPGFGAPARRPVGRLGLVGLLALGVTALAAMTSAQASHQVGTAASSAPSDASADPAGVDRRPVFAFGSVTADGAIVFRLGDAVHAWAVDSAGTPRWQRDLVAGDYVVCGPCPAAVLEEAGGRAVALAADGTTWPAPVEVASGLVGTRSIVGVVLAAARGEGRVELFVPTSQGLLSAGVLDDPRFDQPLVVVTPATGTAAATILQASADPLRQAEFDVVHLTPGGAVRSTVALDEPGARPLPCAVSDADTVAYIQQRPGPTSEGSTHVVVGTDDGPSIDAVVTGSFDACAVGPRGVVLGSAVTGADGDLSRAAVSVVWLDPSLAQVAARTEAVAAPTPSLALDPRTSRAAIAGGSGPAVVADATLRVERPSAAAAAFDDRGGLWMVEASGRVSHEAAP